MSDPATLRAFICVEIPSALGDQLADLAARLRRATPERAARWARPQGIHLTLKFLGDVPVSQVDQIKALMDAAAGDCGPFECTVGGVGCFPNLRQPRVVWVGVRDSGGALERLQRAVEAGAARLGYPREPAGRGFSPHLTLARVGRETRGPDARRLGEAIQVAGEDVLGRLPVEALALMQSDLRPSGAVYTRLYQAHLGRAGS